MFIEESNSIIIKEGRLNGKTLAVFAGVHGNEKAGILAMKDILEEIKVLRGKVFFVFASPKAIEKDVRYVEENLNRYFVKGVIPSSYERQRAIELMKILDESDALLDLHASNVSETTPFIICEKESFDLARKMDFEIISSGWNDIEPGAADGYMSSRGKIGLCLECGYAEDPKKNIDLAKKSILQFLQYFDAIKKDVKYDKRDQKLIHVTKAVLKESDLFEFKKGFYDFEELEDGSTIAKDGDKTYIAKKGEVIIFANPNKKIGEEVFIIGESREEFKKD